MPVPLLVDLPLARRIEGALAADLVAFARARAGLDPACGAGHLAVAGGVAVWTGQFGSRAQAGGLGGPVTDAELDRLYRFLAAPQRGDGRAEIELCPLAAEALAGALDRRPHRLHGFRNVYAARLPARSIAGDAPATDGADGPRDGPAGLAIEAVVGERLAVWSRVLLDGFGYPPGEGRDGVARWNDMMGTVPEATLLLASLDGEPVGASSVLVHDLPEGGGRVASLGGTTTLGPHRRRGVQLALLRHRLGLATGAGCDLAVVTADPGSSSGRNARRAGFALAYTNVRVRLGDVPPT